jgi:hypothetical protein
VSLSTLREARDVEVDARHAYERARRRALLSDKSPKVTRGGYTVAEQTAWVEQEVEDLKFVADKATVTREAAQDHLRTLLAQAEIVRSLGASVRQALRDGRDLMSAEACKALFKSLNGYRTSDIAFRRLAVTVRITLCLLTDTVRVRIL